MHKLDLQPVPRVPALGVEVHRALVLGVHARHAEELGAPRPSIGALRGREAPHADGRDLSCAPPATRTSSPRRQWRLDVRRVLEVAERVVAERRGLHVPAERVDASQPLRWPLGGVVAPRPPTLPADRRTGTSLEMR